MPSPLRRFVVGPHIVFVKGKQLGIVEDPLQFLQNGVTGLGCHPIDRTFVTLYNHAGPPGAEGRLARHPLIPRWPTLFNLQSEISDKN